jgi:hypothetical protein
MAEREERMSSSSVIETVEESPRVRLDPEWDPARELLAQGRRTAEEFCDEIERLRERFLRDKNANLRRGNSPTAQSVPSEGFQTHLETQLGMHHEQARRILDRVRYTRMLRAVADGNAVKYLTGTGRKKHEETFIPKGESRERAAVLLDAVIAGDEKPSAAWAGVVGEQKRVAETGKKERAAVDHYRNCDRAIAKWATSLQHYYDFTEPQQRYLDATWEELVKAGIVPEKWLRSAAKRLQEGHT